MNNNKEYDDYYGAYDEDDDDDFDLGDEDFEARYLSSGIDLKLSESNNISKQQQPEQQAQSYRVLPSSSTFLVEMDKQQLETAATCTLVTTKTKIGETIRASDLIQLDASPEANLTTSFSLIEDDETTQNSLNRPVIFQAKKAIQSTSSISSDLTKLAIQHLDKYQWQLPLMEMDQKFRDKTYYKHYSDSYISSLRSKLGHFLADNQLLTNSMRYHAQKELDNYEKYSKMFDLLTEYYQSLGGSFFSFATPSPDEEIVIGCRLGTKGYYRHTVLLCYFCCCSSLLS